MSKAKARKRRRKRTLGTQRRSPHSNRGALKTARPNLSASADARPRNDPDTRAAGSGNVRTRDYRSSGVPKSYSIKTIAEAKEVSPRTVRRWIATGKLIAHRISGVLRIGEDDFRAFWASYRDA